MATVESTDPENEFRLSISGEHEIAYLRLPGCPNAPRPVSESVRLIDLKPNYKGADVVFDFDENGVLVGIEVLAE